MSAIPYGQKKNGRWAVLHDQCRHCGRTDRPHEAKGFCSNCYCYHRDPAAARAKRKAARLKKNTVAARYPKVRSWCEQNADRVKQSKRTWYLKNRSLKWPVGKTVWVQYCGFWCEGTITERPNNSTIFVKLKGGTVLKTKGSMLRATPPEAAAC